MGHSLNNFLQVTFWYFEVPNFNVLKCKAVIDQYPEQLGDVCLTYADISKAKRLYNFIPKVDIEEGIENFARWFLGKRRQQIL